MRRARAEGGLPDRILVRAHRLAEREQLPAQLQGWTRSALAVLAALFALALFSGIGLALGALGDGARPVNVLWALGALLGLHALTFLLWLASFLLRPAAATGLGRLWLWVTRKLARGPDTALAPQALLNLLARAGAALAVRLDQPPALADRVVRRAGDAVDGAVHRQLPLHLGHHAARAGHLRLADPGDRLAAGPGGLPAARRRHGARQRRRPDLAGRRPGAMVAMADRRGGGLWRAAPAGRRAAVPGRAAAQAGLRIDPALPGHAALRDRLEPAVVSTGLDRPVDPLHEPRLSAPAPAGLDGRPVLLALELPTDLPWPPATTPAGIQIAGRLDTREERRRILDALADAAASRLLIACDARQTPDRGTLTLIAELAAHAQQTRVWLLLPAHEDGPARAAVARAARGAGPARAGRAGGIRQRAGLAGDRTWLIP